MTKKSSIKFNRPTQTVQKKRAVSDHERKYPKSEERG
jgi:hypothetical protein